MSNKTHRVINVKNGVATVRHKCWFCKRKHKLEYPLDDVGMKCNQLCLTCEKGLEKFKKNNPEMC